MYNNMSKDPAFPFYAQDFLTGCMYLTNEEVGIYVRMLSKQWTDNKIPKKRLGLFVGIEWDSFSEELKSKFIDKGEYLINERLELERTKRESFKNKQKINGQKGGRPKKEVQIKNLKETQKKPLEDEYEIENDYDNIKIKKVEKEKLIKKYGIKGYDFMINKLSNYKLSSGKNYKSDYGAINSWVVKEWEKEKIDSKKEKLTGAEAFEKQFQ